MPNVSEKTATASAQRVSRARVSTSAPISANRSRSSEQASAINSSGTNALNRTKLAPAFASQRLMRRAADAAELAARRAGAVHTIL